MLLLFFNFLDSFFDDQLNLMSENRVDPLSKDNNVRLFIFLFIYFFFYLFIFFLFCFLFLARFIVVVSVVSICFVCKIRKKNPQKLTQFKISSKTSRGKKDNTKRHHLRHHKRQPGEQQFPIQVVTG